MVMFLDEGEGIQQKKFVPHKPRDVGGVVGGLKGLMNHLAVRETLVQLALATRKIHTDLQPKLSPLQSCILILTTAEADTEIIGFSDNVVAADKYIELEKKHIDDPTTDLVLVSADSVTAL